MSLLHKTSIYKRSSATNNRYTHNIGFTLIELSIVLVIIGLITGGILTGQSLIDAATIRAQMSQIEKYQTAVHTFQNKYGYLPGDIPNPYASQFGFMARGTIDGEGDGNGVLAGNPGNTSGSSSGTENGSGELAVFWVDLSLANLIDGAVFGYNVKGTGYPDIIQSHAGNNVTSNWLPPARIAQGNYVAVLSNNGINYFQVAQVDKIGWALESTGTVSAGTTAMTVQQAFNMDKKMDDGLPQSGSVTACYFDYDVAASNMIYAGGGAEGASGSPWNCIPTTGATSYASTNCFDNNGVTGAQTYSLYKNAAAQNCALSFRFQ